MSKGLSQSDQGTWNGSTLVIDSSPPPPVDVTPDPYGWPSQIGWGLNETATSEAIILTGMNGPAPLTIDFGLVSVGNRNFTAGPETYTPGEEITMRHNTSGTEGTTVIQTCSVSGVDGTFSTQTEAVAPPPVTGLIFFDDFKTGDLNSPVGQPGIQWYNSNKTSVSADIARSNGFSLKFPFPFEGVGKWSEQRFLLGAGYPEIWVAYYLYYLDGTEGLGGAYGQVQAPNNADNNKLARFWGASPDPKEYNGQLSACGGRTVGLSDQSGNNRISAVWSSHTNPGGNAGTGNVNFATARNGKWSRIIHHLKMASVANNDGTVRIYVEDDAGNPLGDTGRDDIDNYTAEVAGWTTGYLMGFTNRDTLMRDTVVYLDEFQVTTDDPR